MDEQTGNWSRRRFLQATLLTSSLAVTGGCSALGFGDTLARIRDEQVVRIGIANERPYSYLEGDRLEGTIAAVHREVFRRIGDIEVDPVVSPFGRLIEGLDGGRFDTAAAGMFVTPDRCELVAFSDPIYCAPTSLLVAAGNPKQLSDLDSVAKSGARLAVLGGAVEARYARAAGVPQDQIIPVGTPEDGLEAVADGVADALALTSVSLHSLLEQVRASARAAPLPVEVLAPFAPMVDGTPRLGCGAAAFRKPDETLRVAFNHELAALRREGILLDLMSPFGFTQAEMPDPDVITEQLCRVGGVTWSELDPLPR